MPTDKFENFALCLKAISAFLDGNPEAAEQNLEFVRANVAKMPARERGEFRREIVWIISQLSRLELRLAEDD